LAVLAAKPLADTVSATKSTQSELKNGMDLMWSVDAKGRATVQIDFEWKPEKNIK
jgi:hypothetical protein